MRGGIITDRESVNNSRSCHAQSTPRTMTSAMDYEQARFNMVEQQVRTWDVLDQRDPRPAVRSEARRVRPGRLPVAGVCRPRTAARERPARMWAPKLEARVLQELKLKPAESVLEIGTGSGYLAALLGRRAANVTSVEIDAGTVGAGGRHAGANRHRQCPLRGRRRRARMGHRTVRRDRPHRFDAAAPRGLLPAAEARRPHLRDRRRRCR